MALKMRRKRKMSKIKKTAIIVISIFVAIILAGSIVFGVAGFNYDSTINGCVEIRVELDDYGFEQEVRDEYEVEIESIIKNLGYKLVTGTRVELESGTYATIVYSVKGGDKAVANLADSKNSALETKLVEYFNSKGTGSTFSYAEDVNVERVGWSYSEKLLTTSAIAIGVIALAVCVYFVFRFGFASAITTLLSLILEYIVAMGIVAITRIPVGGQVVVVLWSLLALSLLSSLVLNLSVRAERKSAEEGTEQERISRAICKSSKVLFRVLVALVAMVLFAVALVPVNLKINFALIALAVVVIGVNSLLLKPTLRVLLSKVTKEKKTGYALYAKQKENK